MTTSTKLITGSLLFAASAVCFTAIQSSPMPIVIAHPEYAADFSDDKILVGAAHNVFIGQVVGEVGNVGLEAGPETQFKVRVVENIKGALTGDIIVNQEGGYKEGVLYVVEAAEKQEEYLLKAGATYLFATRYNADQNWHTLNSFPTARKLLNSDARASVDSLKSISDSDGRVVELRSAYSKEVLLDADVKSEKTYNSYTDTPGKNRQVELIQAKEEAQTDSDSKRI